MIPEHQFTLTSVETVARATKLFRFTRPEGFAYQSGQFVSIRFTDKAFRAYSIASHPDEEFIELLVRIVPGGLGSTVLDAAKVGDEFSFRGAFGRFGLSENPEAHLVFCCTGTGIAPFRSMIMAEGGNSLVMGKELRGLRAQELKSRKMTLLYGGRDAEDIAYLDEIGTWADGLEVKLGLSRQNIEEGELKNKKEEIRVAPLIKGEASKTFETQEAGGFDSNWHIANTRITHFLKDDQYSADSNHEFYICGNGDMVQSVREILDAKGISKNRIYQERFN